MTDNGSPIDANAASGSAEDFPSKLRVHALARTLGLTSRQVLAHLAELGWHSRSAQSSVERSMAQAVAELTEQASPAFEAAIPILSQLLKAEMAEREVRSVAYQLKAARFPVYRDLAGFGRRDLDVASADLVPEVMYQLGALQAMAAAAALKASM